MFYEKYLKASSEKSSIININLDPALPRQRSSNVIPQKYISNNDEETLLNFSMEIIDLVKDYCCSVKVNTQYFLGAYSVLKKIVEKTHDEGMIAILDHKLSDIGSTNDSAIFWIANMGFDAFTFSPIAGNLKTTVESAHGNGLGVIVLTLMSNPEAEQFMVNTFVNGQPYYVNVAKQVAKTEADGCVVGLTSFVKSKHVKKINAIVGSKAVLLMQGVGPQGGSIANVKYASSPLVSLGREVIYAQDPRQIVKKYHKLIKMTKRTR